MCGHSLQQEPQGRYLISPSPQGDKMVVTKQSAIKKSVFQVQVPVRAAGCRDDSGSHGNSRWMESDSFYRQIKMTTCQRTPCVCSPHTPWEDRELHKTSSWISREYYWNELFPFTQCCFACWPKYNHSHDPNERTNAHKLLPCCIFDPHGLT